MPAIGMPDLTVRRSNRAGVALALDPRIAVVVDSYSWAVIGGPDKAKLSVSGDLSQLWECIEWLRCPIEIRDERDRPVWWGFVNAVQIQAGAIEYGVSLETMANQVAVAYTTRLVGQTTGNRATTDWATNTPSSSTYGVKELLVSADVADSVAAEGLRDSVLDALKYPVPTMRIGDGNQVQATIDCVGWWASAEWRYWSEVAETVGYTDAGTHAYYTATTISFNSASGDIDDTAGGLGVFAVGDVILVTQAPTSHDVYTVDGSSGATNLHVAEALGGGGAGAQVQIENHVVTVGKNTNAQKIAQSFTAPSPAVQLNSISVYARTFDNPTSYRLHLDLYSDSGGDPNTHLAKGYNARGEEGFSGSQEIPAGAPNDFISDDPPMQLRTWRMLDASDPTVEVVLTAGATYWIVLSTDAPGGFDGAEYFVVQRNPAGATGDLQRYDGASWSGTAGTLLHIVSGKKQTTEQIEDIVAGVMPFLTDSIIETVSGMFSDSYRDGDTTARKELEELLAIGTSGGSRLLATVTREKWLRVYPEPAIGSTAYRLGTDGMLKDHLNNPVPSHLCPVGVWVKLVDVIPATADTSTLASPSPFFIDRAEYSPKTNRLRIEPKAAPTPRDIGKVRQG